MIIESTAAYRESLRAFKPRVFVNGALVSSVADEPSLQPGINAIGVTYDLAQDPSHVPLMSAVEQETGKRVNRNLHIDRTSDDLLAKLEAVRIMCREAGCAQRYLVHDAFNGLYQATQRCDAEHGTEYFSRFLNFMTEVQDGDQTYGVAMTDAKGDRVAKTTQSKKSRTVTSTSLRAVPTVLSYPGPRPSSPAHPMCMALSFIAVSGDDAGRRCICSLLRRAD